MFKREETPLTECTELMIVELDDRLEMAAAVLVTDTNVGCNGSGCKQNGYCPLK